MTQTELPAQAANILRNVGGTATCTSTVVESLRLLLLPTGPGTREKPARIDASRSKPCKPQDLPSKAAKSRIKKQPAVTVPGWVEETHDPIKPQERLALATEIFNITLKALTIAIRNPRVSETPRSNRRSLARSSSIASFSSILPSRSQTPLQPISVNRVLQSPAKQGHLERISSGSSHDSNGVRSQAECARIGLACLRSAQAMDVFRAKFAPLQLETGMSALIAKLLALGFDDLALKELRILKRRLETHASNGDGRAGKGVAKSNRRPGEEDTDAEKESLPILLKYNAAGLTGPLLGLVGASQIHALKILAIRAHGPTIEAALEHLPLDLQNSPAALIERQVDPKEPKTTTIAAHQLDILAQTLLRLCPSVSRTAEESAKPQPSISPEVAFQLQSLALQVRLRWWTLLGHQPNVDKELIEPFTRFVGAFQRRCRLKSNTKYRLAKGAYEDIHSGLKTWGGTGVNTSITLLKSLADLASESHQDREAMQWIKAGLDVIDAARVSPSQHCALICQLANLELRKRGESPDDNAELESLRTAVGCLEGDLRGETAELDELLVTIANLRKVAFSVVQDRCKLFGSGELLCIKSLSGQCVQVILASIRFMARYVGKYPPEDASESRTERYIQRAKLASHAAHQMVESLVAIARLSVREEPSVWRSLEMGLRDCTELATSLESACANDRGTQKLTGRSLPLHVSIAQAYWFRFLALKSTAAAAKTLVSCLKASIDVLTHRPISEKISGSLLAKLEKYASLCETLKDYKRALQTYEEAIRLSVDAGVTHKVTEAAAAALSPVALAGDRDLEILSRILFAYPKAASRASRPCSGARGFFDMERLCNDQRGWLLGQQLASLAAVLSNQGTSTVDSDDFHSLASLLLTLYTKDDFPIRRLHVCVRILQLFSTHPSVLESRLNRIIFEEVGQRLSLAVGCPDKHLEPYTTHLVSSRDVYTLLHSSTSGSRLLEKTIANWCTLVQQCPDWASLQKQVYDIPGWLQQLELIADYLQAEGNGPLRISVLHLLVAVHEGASSMQCLDLVSKLTDLGIQYARLGYSGHGGVTLQKAQRYLEVSDVPISFQVKWYLTNADYSLINMNLDKSCDFLEKARQVSTSGFKRGRSTGQTINERTASAQYTADALFIQSRVEAELGNVGEAIFFARMCVQDYQRIWATIEHHIASNSAKVTAENAGKTLNEVVSELSISERQTTASSSKYAASKSPALWALSSQLFRSLLHLSQYLAHNGLLPEAQYYLEQCQGIADAICSPFWSSTCQAVRGKFAICGGDTSNGLAVLGAAKQALLALPVDRETINSITCVALHYVKGGQTEAGSTTCSEAMVKLANLMTKPAMDSLIHKPKVTELIELQMSGLSLSDAVSQPPRKGTTRAVPKRAPIKSRTQPKSSTVHQAEELPPLDILPLNSIKGDLLRLSAVSSLSQGSLETAASQLDVAATLPSRQEEAVEQGLLNAQLNLRRGLQQLIGDPVYSVIPESTICCPAAISEQRSLPKSSPQKPSRSAQIPTGKPPNKKSTSGDKITATNHSQYLSLAQNWLNDVYKMSKKHSSTSTVHAITETLGKVLTMVSALPTTQAVGSCSTQFIAYILELGRRAAMQRESLVIDVERQLSNKRDFEDWPQYKGHKYAGGLQQSIDYDFSTFREEYIDIIPKPWTVLSITLSESHEEIWVSKLRAGQSPFILRLPFNRENTPECNDEGFSFDLGKSEMVDIINLANTSAHTAADLSRKGAKTEWWDARATLDTRLKDLMTNIESIWFGGFRGIFSSDVPDPALLARFEQSLQNVFDKHLPSRQGSTKAKQTTRVNLDPRVLELFVGLGAPSEENDVDEQLMDLLYFVVDILQFNKERNAYDEIDFDAIVVETADALRYYHQAVGEGERFSDKKHTILILDRNLHCFPWESLPCMRGQSLSRLPSLGCMRERILQVRKQRNERFEKEPQNDGICINANHGAYVLNPGGDLANTQATFEEPLQALSNWERFVEREPSETDMKSCLQDNKIFLYFGHGSGAQYIRSRTIKKLDQCAVALLMGCSSGALTEAGEYEAYGTPINYMHAGSPAVLATLWDVTDKDIDRFSKEVLQRWGLFKNTSTLAGSPVKKSAKQKGKMKVKEKEMLAESSDGAVSLDEAVAKSRDSCILRYLNGAAPVVYGVPVYLS